MLYKYGLVECQIGKITHGSYRFWVQNQIRGQNSTRTINKEKNGDIFLFGKTDIMTIHGFHDSNSGYGADSLIYMDYHGPYLDRAVCKMWNASGEVFDDVLSFNRVTMNNFTGWIYFHPNFPILFGHCEYVRLSTLRGTASVELI